jgi:hypothetical protein
MRRVIFFLSLFPGLFSSAAAGETQANNKEDEAQIKRLCRARTLHEIVATRRRLELIMPKTGLLRISDNSYTGGKLSLISMRQSLAPLTRETTTRFQLEKIKFLRPDVAVLDIDGTLSGATRLAPGLKAHDDGSLHMKLQEVMEKENGAGG